MARGYPDYFGQSAWPKYGKLYVAEWNQSIDSGNDADIVSLSMQGQVVSGNIRVVMAASPIDVLFTLTVDDLVVQLSWDRFMYTDMTGRNGYPIELTYAGDDWLWHVYRIGAPVPFRTTFSINLLNQAAASVSIESIVGYYQVI